MNEKLLHQLVKGQLGQSVYEDFLRLPDDAKQEVITIVTELQDRGESETLNRTWQEDFIRVPPTPEEFLTDPYYVGEKAKAIYPKWREELLHVLDARNGITEWLICLAGDTMVPLLDGSLKTLEELHTVWEEDNEPFWVYSISPEGQVLPGRCEAVTKSPKDQLYKVTLDDGTSFRANAPHEMVMRDGTKKMIKDMVPGDRLMPFHAYFSPAERYERSYNPATRKSEHTHRLIAEAENKSTEKVRVVRALRDAGTTIADLKRERLQKRRKDSVPRGRVRPGVNAGIKDDVLLDDIYETYEREGNLARTYKALKADRKRVVRILGDHGLTLDDLRAGYRNHKVVSVEKDAVEHVYCLHVPQWGNFAVVTSLKKAEEGAHRYFNRGDIIGKSGVLSGNTGAIGTGKSFASIFAQAYKLAYLACLKNPQKFSGLADDTSIVFSVFNLTIDKTQLTLYNDLKVLLDTSPFFRETFPLRAVYGSRGQEKEVTMPKGVTIISGSKATHALSTNVFSCVLDEMNFRDSKNVRITYSDQSEAFKLYSSITRRITSRYIGFSPGLLCLISSRQTITDFLEEHIEKARCMPHVHVSDFPLWETKPSIAFQSGKTFRMAVGNQSHHRSSRILEDYEELAGAGDYTIIDNIPVELKSAAILDPDGFVRDVAGAATYPSSPLISTKERIMDCTDMQRQHPFSAQSICLNIHTADTIQDSLIHELIVRDTGRWGYEPLIEPNIPRSLAVDLSRVGDSTGIAMGFPHSAKSSTVVHYNPVTGLTEEITRLIWHYYYDFLLEIIPPPQGRGEIDFDKIEEWILYLSEELHFILDVVSFDGWQSDHMRQRLDKKGFNAVIFSVDKNDVAYVELRQAITERRANFYDYVPFGPELGFLQHHRRGTKGALKGKVDHLKGKKKDVCDAAASVAFHCSKFPENNALVLPPGSSPFYREQRGRSVNQESTNSFLIDDAYEEATTRGRKKRKIIGVD